MGKWVAENSDCFNGDIGGKLIIRTSYEGCLKEADFGLTQLVAMRINLDITALDHSVGMLFYLLVK